MNRNVDNRYQIELVKRTCEGDISAFHEIVELYKKKVYYIAFDICGDHQEAEDISQEVFIKVFRFIKKFRMDAKLSTWIHQVSVNTSIDALRKYKKKQIFMETAELESLPPETSFPGSGISSPESLTARDLFQQRLRQALPGLSKKEQVVFVMRYLNGIKLLEISEIMNISINTIKSILLRAKKKLRKKLAPYYQDFGWNSNPEVPYE